MESSQIGRSRFEQARFALYDRLRTVTSPELIAQNLILPRVAAGESRAMNLCITQYGGIVWSIAKRYIKDNSEAEDLV